MDWTDMHYRQLARLISRHTWLYTEMVVDMTILHSPYTDRCGFLACITMPEVPGCHQACRAHVNSARGAAVPIVVTTLA